MTLDPPRHDVRPSWPNDHCLGALVSVGGAIADATRCAIVGFPSDEGVRRNGGRPGARLGPEAVRRWLYRLTPDARDAERFTALCRATVDLGDVRCSSDVEADQGALAVVVADLLSRGIVPVVLGGGHETTYGHALGFVRAGRAVRLVNVDAHADVRETVDGQGHSGSPFRQALEHPSGLVRGYTVAGLQPHAVSEAHVQYVGAAGGTVVWRDEVTSIRLGALYTEAAGPEAVLASFDLDAVDAAFAPGVSAPNAGGLDREVWLAACEAAGASPLVHSVDLVELNPKADVDGRTARLAALSVWRVLRGLARRP